MFQVIFKGSFAWMLCGRQTRLLALSSIATLIWFVLTSLVRENNLSQKIYMRVADEKLANKQKFFEEKLRFKKEANRRNADLAKNQQIGGLTV